MALPPLVEPAEALTPEEVRRYSRHLIIPDVGMIGQRRLKNARVLVIGAGGLGSPALLYLAAAGVGTLGVVEFDTVDESNLQRQIIHGQSDIGKSKALSAKESIAEVIHEDTGLTDEQSQLLAVSLVGMAQVSARFWLDTGGGISQGDAATLVSGLAWRGIRGYPRADEQV